MTEEWRRPLGTCDGCDLNADCVFHNPTTPAAPSLPAAPDCTPSALARIAELEATLRPLDAAQALAPLRLSVARAVAALERCPVDRRCVFVKAALEALR